MSTLARPASAADRAVSGDCMMAVMAGRALAHHRVCFVGIGVPSMAAILAQRLYKPGLALVYESGAQGAHPERLPLSTGSPAVASGADMLGSMLEVFGALQAGLIEVGLLSGAQVDHQGNLNSTRVGEGERAVRLPGSGGAHDIALLAGGYYILMPHDPRRFRRQVDVVTSPGHSLSLATRRRMRLGAGPLALFTERARFDFDDGELTLSAIIEGDSADEVLAAFPWVVPRRAHVDTIERPTTAEMAVLASLEGIAT